MKFKITLSNFTFLFLFITQITISQTTYYVDASRSDNSGNGITWGTAKKDLQIAINGATSGDVIWVKAGTYLPTHDPFGNATPANNRDKTFTLKNGVKIYGGFVGTETQLNQRNWKSNRTILSGDLGVTNSLTDNAYHVVVSVNLNNTTNLDGFTITKGYATAPGGSTITYNTRVLERYHGGGIFNSYSGTNFTNCTITQNSADCTNTDNDAVGAGIINNICTSTYTNCTIDGNSFLVGGASFGVFGAGMEINGGSCVINRCVFSNNTSGSGFLDASRGGALDLNGTHTITNSVFYNNSAQNGAALQLGGGDSNTSLIVNCSFINNTSSFAGTAYQGFSKATFQNCLFWNNAPTSSSVAGRNEIYSQETRIGFQSTFQNCIIRDAVGSPLAITNAIVSNCLNSNPLFVNVADGDGIDNVWATSDDGLAIQNASPAKNFGLTGAGIPTTDIVGATRDAQPDLGAYEYQNPCVNPTVFNITGGGSYCVGGLGQIISLLSSENGVTYQLKNGSINVGTAISGTGNQISFGYQTAAGTYTILATRVVGGCTSVMNGNAVITINPNITPTFASVSPICSGQSLSALPTTSTNGITGTWSPALNTTQTTTYSFTPSAGQCATTASMTIIVNTTPAPTAQSIQDACSTSTLTDFVVDGQNLLWYESLTSTVALPLTTVLVANTVYYVSQTISGCESATRIPVTANGPCLNVERFNELKLNYNPNPVLDYLYVSSSEKVEKYELINGIGQFVSAKDIESLDFEIDMKNFPAGIYYIRLFSDVKMKTLKIIKK